MKIVSRMAALTFATLLVSSLALAGGTAAPAAKTASAGKTTTHQVSATVVSVDTKTHSITLKDDQGQEHTAPAMGNAIKEIATLKPGTRSPRLARTARRASTSALSPSSPRSRSLASE